MHSSVVESHVPFALVRARGSSNTSSLIRYNSYRATVEWTSLLLLLLGNVTWSRSCWTTSMANVSRMKNESNRGETTEEPVLSPRLQQDLTGKQLGVWLDGRTIFNLSERRIQGAENNYLKKLLRISCMGYRTNDFVRSTIVGHQEPLLATLKWCKVAWLGLLTRHDTVIQGILEGHRRTGKKRRKETVKWWKFMTQLIFITGKQWTNL